MLRIDNKAALVRLPWSIGGMFSGRYAVRSSRRIFGVRWKNTGVEMLLAGQQEYPMPMFTFENRQLWYFHDRFYWDDDGLEAEDVMALVLQRERRTQQKLQTAHSLMRAEASGRPTRAPIPIEIRRVVFERDGGRCVECNSNFNLQYDHILPVALGGATTVENIQLLCADCNLEKSDSL